MKKEKNINQEISGEKKKKKLSPVKIILFAVLGAVALFVIVAFIDALIESINEEPVDPSVSVTTSTSDSKDVTVLLENTVTIPSENSDEVYKPLADEKVDEGAAIDAGEIAVKINTVTPDEEKKIKEDTSLGVLQTGKTKEGNTFIARGDQVVISKGDKKIKATVTKNEKKADVAKVASLVTAAVEEKTYEEVSDYNNGKALYFWTSVDCHIQYPAQLKLVYADDSYLIFADPKSGAKLDVIAEKEESKTASIVAGLRNEAYTKEIFSKTGNGLKVTAVLSYPDNLSYVYSVLKKHISIEFMEQQDGAFESAYEPDGSNTEFKDIYFPAKGTIVSIPLEFETESYDFDSDCMTLKDSNFNFSMKISFVDVTDDMNVDNLFDMFEVVAEDGDVFITEDYVKWHNNSGIFMGGLGCANAVLVEIDGADSWLNYKECFDDFGIYFTDDQTRKYVADDFRVAKLEELTLASDPGEMSDSGLDVDDDEPLDESDPGEMSDPGLDVDDNEPLDESDPGEMSDPGLDADDEPIAESDPGDLGVATEYLMHEETLFEDLPFDELLDEEDSLLGVYKGNMCYYIRNAGDEEWQLLKDALIKMQTKYGCLLFEDVDEYGNWRATVEMQDGVFVKAIYSSNQLELIAYDVSNDYEPSLGDVYIDPELIRKAHNNTLDDYFNIERLSYDIEAFLREVDGEVFGIYHHIHDYFYYITMTDAGEYLMGMMYKTYGDSFITRRFMYKDYTLYEIEDDGSFTKVD